jgi:hypothetical protein
VACVCLWIPLPEQSPYPHPMSIQRPKLCTIADLGFRHLAYRKTLALLAVVWIFIQPIRAGEPKPNFVQKPTIMSVMIGGAFGQSYEVTYDERELRYYSAKNFFELRTTKPIIIKPSNEQWQTFFDELERMKAWKWKRDYTNPNVDDGVSWRAFISYETRDARDLVSRGSNAFPTDFKAFLAAVRKVIADKKFE